jgi:hypothetical protein
MKKELLYFYPKVMLIKWVGTPQFEPYTMEQYSCSKDEFYTLFEIKIRKLFVLVVQMCIGGMIQ